MKNSQGMLERMQRHFACHPKGVVKKPKVFKKFFNPGFAASALANSLKYPKNLEKVFGKERA